MAIRMMKAVRLHEFGGPEVLRYEDVPIPELQPGEVLVRVHAVGVNPPDWYLREGYRALPPQFRPSVPLPVIPGSDVSGVIEAVAEDVQGLTAGDEVFGMVRFPSHGKSDAYAQYVAAPASDLAKAARSRSPSSGWRTHVGAYGLAVPGRPRAQRAEPAPSEAASGRAA